MKIGEFALKHQVSVRTVRHYENIGLLLTPEREGKYRIFDKDAHARMEFIAKCKIVGLTLAEIGEVIHFFDAPRSERCKMSLQVLDTKKQQLQAKVSGIQNSLNKLNQLEKQIEERLKKC
jgi:DNA-binding transcriptional MerR regulator